jgi:hypothetical protein
MNIKIADFKKDHQPSQKKAKMYPFLGDIRSLKESGYSLKEICEYLKINDISITISGLQKFIKKSELIQIDNTCSEQGKIGHDQESQQDSPDDKIGHDQKTKQSASEKIGLLKVPVPKKFEHDSKIDPNLLK